jgi:AraC-like DNA-binding protein
MSLPDSTKQQLEQILSPYCEKRIPPHVQHQVRMTYSFKNEVRMETIAELLGYESEAAFRKAFKREIGMPPAQYRRLG